jgi:hypothetical protein
VKNIGLRLFAGDFRAISRAATFEIMARADFSQRGNYAAVRSVVIVSP